MQPGRKQRLIQFVRRRGGEARRGSTEVWSLPSPDKWNFYAPWCGYCKKLEPVWHDVGVELKTSGSPVRVGKMDATAYSGMSSEFGVRGYPTIKLLKGDLAYNYKGPRTKDDIVEFANRVAGPAVRALPSKQMFEHMMKRHNVLFVYVGGESPLKEKYNDVAAELIVYTYFFSAPEEVFPESVTLPELPAVVVFKDGAYFTYDVVAVGQTRSAAQRPENEVRLGRRRPPARRRLLHLAVPEGRLPAPELQQERLAAADADREESALRGVLQDRDAEDVAAV
ncbi:Protein disulfide-isomerase TMX3 [Liparis tanakae]|uniref:protein disulfide-isomerase n=1 Tax=Liparis tanakae TaxID=230148 RepID=A0A4Z2FT84_9TELE|nr:Protein disulfide-isomerase TMX3 [Liparis tanakae]